MKLKNVNICEKCGSEVSKTSAFCGNCGAKFEIKTTVESTVESNTVICPNCNSSVEGGSNFCPGCGTKVR